MRSVEREVRSVEREVSGEQYHLQGQEGPCGEQMRKEGSAE